MPLRTSDESFIRNLQSVDPLLDCRWSDLLSSWVIDRKGVVPVTEIEFLIKRERRAAQWAREAAIDEQKKKWDEWKGICEELQSARVGRRVIFFTRNLDRRCFDRLALGDIQRYGGYSRFADELEKQDREEQKSRERDHSNELYNVNEEAFSQLNFLWNKRDAKLHSGERNLNRLLHG